MDNEPTNHLIIEFDERLNSFDFEDFECSP